MGVGELVGRRDGFVGPTLHPPPCSAALVRWDNGNAARSLSTTVGAGTTNSPSEQPAATSNLPPIKKGENLARRPLPSLLGPRGIPSRDEQLHRLQEPNKVFDLLVIGGGATGAGIALDAASRGLSVACIERGDFASETSSRSTKLVWAGIRYLGTAFAALLSRQLLWNPIATIREFVGEFQMVLHCHKERKYMTHTQQHLCQWIPIAVPFTSWHISPPPMKHPLYGFFPLLAPFVFKFYDALSTFSCPPSYILTKTRAKQVFPQLFVTPATATSQQQQQQQQQQPVVPPAQTKKIEKRPELKYCAVFYEAQHNDARTNVAIALTAAEKGAVICNYVQAEQLLLDSDIDHIDHATGDVSSDRPNPATKATGARVTDRRTGTTWNVRANKIVLAGGPFTDDLRRLEHLDAQPVVQGAAGTHVVLPGYFLPPHLGLLDPNTSDGRFLFVLPWEGHTLVGTTDRKGPAVSLPAPPEEDIDWILKECQRYLGLTVRRSDVLSAWTGWRPLAADPNMNSEDAPVSRDHVISENPRTGVIFVAGGKWTTWRQMAEDATNRVVGANGPRCRTLEIKLLGGDGYTSDLPYQLIQSHPGLPLEVAEHLARTYGNRAWEVCELASASGTALWPQFGRPLVPGFPYIDAEVRYACREYACTIEDVLSRRTRLAFLNKRAAVSAIPLVADLMAQELGWSGAQKREEMISARLYLESYGGQVPQTADALLREASQESPERLFVTLDRDGSGYIDFDEVAEAVSILGLTLSDAQLEKFFRQMDRSGSGRVSAEDFRMWWDRFRQSKAYEQMVIELDRGRQAHEA